MFYVINTETNKTLIITTNKIIAKQVAKFLN